MVLLVVLGYIIYTSGVAKLCWVTSKIIGISVDHTRSEPTNRMGGAIESGPCGVLNRNFPVFFWNFQAIYSTTVVITYFILDTKKMPFPYLFHRVIFIPTIPPPKKHRRSHVRSGRSTPMTFPYNRGWSLINPIFVGVYTAPL